MKRIRQNLRAAVRKPENLAGLKSVRISGTEAAANRRYPGEENGGKNHFG